MAMTFVDPTRERKRYERVGPRNQKMGHGLYARQRPERYRQPKEAISGGGQNGSQGRVVDDYSLTKGLPRKPYCKNNSERRGLIVGGGVRRICCARLAQEPSKVTLVGKGETGFVKRVVPHPLFWDP